MSSLPGVRLRGLLLLGTAGAFFGYVGPFVDHQVAGLAILGLDLGEYVKFLPQVRSGVTPLWREGFYLPLVTVSLALSLCAWRPEFWWRPRFLGWAMIAVQVCGAIAAALNLLPPAWTPLRMLTPEFQLQALAIALCLGAVALGPFLALLPRVVTGLIILLLAGTAAVVPVAQFLWVLPEIGGLYNRVLVPGWGTYLMVGGLVLLMVLGGLLASSSPAFRRRPRQTTADDDSAATEETK